MVEEMGSGLSLHLRQDGPIPFDAKFHCGPGEVLALVGPSGSGKSTMLRSIAGLYRALHGRISCHGETWFNTESEIDWAPQTRSVGLVFQNYALFPHMTAERNIMAAMDHLRPSARKKRASELLTLVHLGGLESRYPIELSGGQQQRVAVARALGRDPKVLLLDEPFSAVDRVTRQKLYRELAELRRQLPIPVVLVTHDLDEAAM
ncbi:MAG: ATP-binding cassette domain-containing protein, partial [Burkholderiales bacterium]|nr:ATP-binding cassette domain-containing protein [Burkholderiales bacterium]